VTVFWNSEDDVLTDFLKKSATVNSEHYTENLKNLKTHITRKEAETDVLFQQDNARPHTSAATTDATALLYLQCYYIQPTARISLLVISTCSPN
jgi:outer membrane PBP1 activator LpoA protein